MTRLPIDLSMSVNALISCMLVGATLLAGWILVRFERIGPRSLIGATCAWAGSAILIVALPPVIEGVLATGMPGARTVVLFGLALPIFTSFFLTGGWFMRSLMNLVDGLR